MRLLLALLTLPIVLAACTTTKYVEVPVYPVVLLERPEPLYLENMQWDFINGYFALSPEEFDKYRNNLQEIDIYIRMLQEGWTYYESVSQPEPES